MAKDTKEIQNHEQEVKLIAHLADLYNLGLKEYRRDFKRMQMLDLTDRGEIWRTVGQKFPAYQILPDTNFVSYLKANLVASIYTVTKSAEILPTSEQDKDLCVNLNVALAHLWDIQRIGFYQFQAGERAALLNIGITQVGWDENVIKGTGDTQSKGNVRLRNIDPLKFMRDPYAVDLATSGWCCTYDHFHKSVFQDNKLYKEKFKVFLQKNTNGDTMASTYQGPDRMSKSGAKDYYTLVKWWVKNDDGGIDEIHTVNNSMILYEKKDIKPSCFPFALCYCNLPAEALVGTSEPARIFANNIAYNLMDSLLLTAEYKNQHPPKFITDKSMLNVQAFSKHGDEADRTFIVAGDATKAVHYHQFPAPSNMVPVIKQSLERGIQNTSGVDGRYTGRDTGSIITTGGTEEMLNRVTLIDTPKILMYENYVRDLTELVLLNMLQWAPKRKFFRKKPDGTGWLTKEVDFPNIDKKTLFNYRVAISSELPKNKQRIAAVATELLQAQSQYRDQGSEVNWITEEEWLMFQDLPNKEYMLERMGVQRQENALEDVAQVIWQYGQLSQQGLAPEEAMRATAESLMQKRQGNPAQTATSGADPGLEMMAQGMGGMM